METHLDANDLWEAVQEEYVVSELQARPTLAQIKNHNEKKTRKSKPMATLFFAVSTKIFIKIMTINVLLGCTSMLILANDRFSPPSIIESMSSSMANLPHSSSVNAAFGSTSTIPGEMQLAERLVFDIINPDLRENALSELAKKRERFQDLGPLLWHSFGIMAVFLQEIKAIYPALSPPTLTTDQSNRICNVLALLQCVASHIDTRNLFIDADIPSFLYPFLSPTSNLRSFEYLRLTCLGVIGAMVKFNNTKVTNYLIKSEIMPMCLNTMDYGTELSKTVATFIVQKILLDNAGLNYVCSTQDRFLALAQRLDNMVNNLVEQPSDRLLKHIVKCYLRLSEDQRALGALKGYLPIKLRDGTFTSSFRMDPTTRGCLLQLLKNVEG
ncbi:CCR4-NOT transcription complex subunit 9-like [Impatiens glandulifera]|uniref:CCR4-NOT transcription complex subunit 9-like n=1 Tax=Impatiens glandulifera TaxID=253017 RepID=UPI001FB0CE19|nr:CCR4-NOT transcription complex subunit 9-like [Impatiens glandulifera]